MIVNVLGPRHRMERIWKEYERSHGSEAKNEDYQDLSRLGQSRNAMQCRWV